MTNDEIIESEVLMTLEKVSSAWMKSFKTRPMLLKTVCEDAQAIPELYYALCGVCCEVDEDSFGKYQLSTSKLAWFLKNVGGKPINGFRFVRGSGSLYWSLVPCDESNKEKEKAQARAPAPPPQDLHGDIHLMAMTILEKLQPVLLNAIYTELMEHKK